MLGAVVDEVDEGEGGAEKGDGAALSLVGGEVGDESDAVETAFV